MEGVASLPKYLTVWLDMKQAYNKLPLKDNNGDVERDINKIYEYCLNLSLQNNKQVIKNKLNNEKVKALGFDKKLIENLKSETKLDTEIDKLIDKIHDTFTNKGFLREKQQTIDNMSKMRSMFLNKKSNTINTPK